MYDGSVTSGSSLREFPSIVQFRFYNLLNQGIKIDAVEPLVQWPDVLSAYNNNKCRTTNDYLSINGSEAQSMQPYGDITDSMHS